MNLDQIADWLREWITPRARGERRALRERAIYALALPMLVLFGVVLILDVGALVAGRGDLPGVLMDLLGMASMVVVRLAARRGQIRLSSVSLVIVYLAVVAFYVLREGYQSVSSLLFLIAVVAAGLTLGARAGIVAATISLGVYGFTAWAEVRGWVIPVDTRSPVENVLLFALLVYLLAGLAASFGRWANRATREYAETLSTQVDALAAADREKAELVYSLQEQIVSQERLLSDLRASDEAQAQLRSTLRQTSSPVIPVLDEVVVVPISGELDAARMEQILGDAMQEIDDLGAQLAILDITGVSSVDEGTVDILLRVIDGIGLLGTECVLVGMRPEVARAVIEQGLELDAITCRRDLQGGIEYALSRTGRRIATA